MCTQWELKVNKKIFFFIIWIYLRTNTNNEMLFRIARYISMQFDITFVLEYNVFFKVIGILCFPWRSCGWA